MIAMDCELIIECDARHLQQVYTGLLLLEQQGLIRLRFRVVRPKSKRSLCTLHLADQILVFDLHDSEDFYTEALSTCDLYFKRSYSSAAAVNSGYADKIKPYGLNYHIVPDVLTRLYLQKTLAYYGPQELCKYLIKKMDKAQRWHFEPTVRNLEVKPALSVQPRILFMARVWDHEYDVDFEMTAAYSEERLRMNEVRAGCIRALKKEFGSLFTGGLEHSAYAKKHFKDCLANTPGQTSKRNYIELVKQHPICISTAGLNKSIGWKFAEYVCLSRAIVSERLAFEVPGPFAKAQNYLEFDSVDSCVEAVHQLVHDTEKMAAMMQANASYYQAYVRPDVLVRRCLEQVMMPHNKDG